MTAAAEAPQVWRCSCGTVRDTICPSHKRARDGCTSGRTTPGGPPMQNETIPVGYCQCGCGEKTRLASKTDRSSGRVRGMPMRFLIGHQMRSPEETKAMIARLRASWDGTGVSFGSCQCGCDARTPLAKRTDAGKMLVQGQPLRFLPGHANHLKRTPLEARFWAKVSRGAPDACWLWPRVADATYGTLSASDGSNAKVLAHRLSWELANGRSVPDGLEVCHSCDVPRCVNPAHLFVGTHRENLLDAKAKGRTRSSRHNATLTLDDADAIRAAWEAGGITQAALARRFGVSSSTVSRTAKGLQNARR